MEFDQVFIMDIIIILFGLYILFTTIKMQKKGVIDKLIMAESEIKKVKDKKGFIEFMSPRLIGFACVIIADGIFGVITDKFVKVPYANIIILVSFLAAVIYLMNRIRVSKEKF